MAVNVLTLNVQAFESCGDECEKIFSKMSSYKPDIICTQEDLIDSPFSEIAEAYGYKLVDQCEAEWHSGTKLSNKIYTGKDVKVTESGSKMLKGGCETPRCAVFAKIGGVVIVNLHMCGGKFDDSLYDKLSDTRSNDIRDIIRTIKPDLIVGDFNSEPTSESSLKTLSRHPMFKGLSHEEKEKFLEYYTSHHQTLEESGYLPAYTVKTVGKTSIFGGTPDLMYYNPDSLNVKTVKNTEYFIENGLSDHNGVVVKFDKRKLSGQPSADKSKGRQPVVDTSKGRRPADTVKGQRPADTVKK